MNSYSINQLYESAPQTETDSFERLNPLTDHGSLTEAQLVDVRLSAQRSQVGIIIDLRSSLHFVACNAALIVLAGVQRFGWDNEDSYLWEPHSWGPFYLSWEPIATADKYTLDMPGIMFGRLTVSAARAVMYVGKIDELSDDRAVPDMSEDSDAAIIGGYPQWSSTMTVHEYYRYPESKPVRYTCLVCGYPDLDDLPLGPSSGRRHVSCPSCGFQFSHMDTDLHYTYEQWRDQWIARGMPWSSTDTQPPRDWSPAKQLMKVTPPRPGRYICLVCGYPQLTKPYGNYLRPSYEICPCCGYQYGYDDYVWTPIDRRAEWIDDGMRWWSREGPPPDWDPKRQLKRLEALPRGRHVGGLTLGGRRLHCF